jgi:hypothetical protein
MPIDQLLAERQLSPEMQHVLTLAFNDCLSNLGLIDRNDPVCEIVACKVFEIGKRGINDAVAISEIAVGELLALGPRD